VDFLIGGEGKVFLCFGFVMDDGDCGAAIRAGKPVLEKSW